MTIEQDEALSAEVRLIKTNAEALLAYAEQRNPGMCIAAMINLEEARQRAGDILKKAFPAVARLMV